MKPYGIGMPVKKIECINHLLRNLCGKILAVAQNTSYPIRLRKILQNNVLRFRKGVISAAKHWNSQNLSEEDKIKELKLDIKNTTHHIFGDHSNCR